MREMIIFAISHIFLLACNNKNTNQPTSTVKNSITYECDCKVKGIVKYMKKGIAVMNEPNGKIIDTLYSDMEEEKVGPFIMIISSQQGWIKINYDTSGLYGWIKGKQAYLLAMNFDCDTSEIALYNQPDKSSAIVNRLRGSRLPKPEIQETIINDTLIIRDTITFYDAAQQEVKILGCCKNWAYVEGEDKTGNKVRGWLPPDKQCADPFSACLPCVVNE